MKPSNIMLQQDESGSLHVTLIDLGIARRLDLDQKLTKTDSVIGTMSYMSPEQCSGGVVDVRSDLYSLGCIMYECATGRLPFAGNEMEQVLGHTQPNRPRAPRPVETIVDKLMRLEPTARFQNADETLMALREINFGSYDHFIESNRGKCKKWPKQVLAGAAALAITLVGGPFIYGVLPTEHCERRAPQTLTQSYVTLFESLQEAAITNDVKKQKDLVKLLEKQPDNFWREAARCRSISVFDQLKKIFSDQRKSGDLATADQTYSLLERAISATGLLRYQAYTALEMLADCYYSASIYDDKVINLLSGIANEQRFPSLDRQTAFIRLANCYRSRRNWNQCLLFHKKATQFIGGQSSKAKLISDNDAAISYANMLTVVKPDPSEQKRLIGIALDSLIRYGRAPGRDSISKEDMWGRVRDISTLTYRTGIKLNEADLCKLEKLLQSCAETPAKQIETRMMIGTHKLFAKDRSGTDDFLRALKAASEQGLWRRYVEIVCALSELSDLPKEQKIKLLADGLSKLSALKPPDFSLNMHLSYRMGYEISDHGKRPRLATQFFEQAIEQCKQAQVCAGAEGDLYSAAYKVNMCLAIADLASNAGEYKLARASVSEIDRVPKGDLPNFWTQQKKAWLAQILSYMKKDRH